MKKIKQADLNLYISDIHINDWLAEEENINIVNMIKDWLDNIEIIHRLDSDFFFGNWIKRLTEIIEKNLIKEINFNHEFKFSENIINLYIIWDNFEWNDSFVWKNFETNDLKFFYFIEKNSYSFLNFILLVDIIFRNLLEKLNSSFFKKNNWQLKWNVKFILWNHDLLLPNIFISKNKKSWYKNFFYLLNKTLKEKIKEHRIKNIKVDVNLIENKLDLVKINDKLIINWWNIGYPIWLDINKKDYEDDIIKTEYYINNVLDSFFWKNIMNPKFNTNENNNLFSLVNSIKSFKKVISFIKKNKNNWDQENYNILTSNITKLQNKVIEIKENSYISEITKSIIAYWINNYLVLFLNLKRILDLQEIKQNKKIYFNLLTHFPFELDYKELNYNIIRKTSDFKDYPKNWLYYYFNKDIDFLLNLIIFIKGLFPDIDRLYIRTGHTHNNIIESINYNKIKVIQSNLWLGYLN